MKMSVATMFPISTFTVASSALDVVSYSHSQASVILSTDMKLASTIPLRVSVILVIGILATGRLGFGKDAATPVPPPPPLTAQSALLMDVSTGEILWQKNAEARRPPASLTKIITALLILEDKRLDDWVAISPTVLSAWGSLADLKPGDRITQHDLLYDILLKSANDACDASAEHVAGNLDAFVARMNQRAVSLGAVGTHFANPHGLHSPQHLTTAHDLALMARYALGIPMFRQIVNTKVGTIRWQGAKGPKSLRLINKNKLLWRWNEVDGVKTGYTKQAGNCLVASATRNGWQLLAVVMKAANTWHEAAALLKYGFANFSKMPLVPRGGPVTEVVVRKGAPSKVPVVASSPLEAVVPKGHEGLVHYRCEVTTQCAPLSKGRAVGWAIAENGGHELCRIPLVIEKDVPVAWPYRPASYLLFAAAMALCWLGARWNNGASAKSSRKSRRRLAPGR